MEKERDDALFKCLKYEGKLGNEKIKVTQPPKEFNSSIPRKVDKSMVTDFHFENDNTNSNKNLPIDSSKSSFEYLL